MQKINWIILASKDRGINYGVGTFIKQLSKALKKHENINVFIIETGITCSKLFSIRIQEGITVLEIPVPENKTGIDSRKNQEKLSRNISFAVSQYLPGGCRNIIHMNYLFQYFIAMGLKTLLNAKIIFTQHIIAAEELRTLLNGKVIFTNRDIPSDDKLGGNYFDTEIHTYQIVDVIVAVTKSGKQHLIDKGADPTRIKVIYNGTDPSYFKYKKNGTREKYGIGKKEKLILYTGRLENEKGLSYLCAAMAELIKKIPGCRLVMAGNGNFESIISLTNKFSGHISFLGFIPFEDVISLCHEADIEVIPSLQEQCSYAAIEMLHCGLPVVTSDIGGLKEIFVHNENALLTNMIPDTNNGYGK
ncbi:MAG: glycosyltransferase, partial [Atribacterota bacterium]|nr:glycosyltransferase [Atribacterota bacterium]